MSHSTEPVSSPESFASAASAFRRFFEELRAAFFERECLLLQLELGLLSREHVLVIGPPGTAKSAVASAVLGRILDADTGAPSLFSKQLSESTVQADLIGPVDFKVLTETGRTEHLFEEGMLGATHAFLDEVFDGRDMLLRSILNVLHERELKHGKKVSSGRFECAVMTSNRYLSEVLSRSPELLLAFADRLSFICYCPKAFARPSSRAAMLARSVNGQRPELKAQLTLQQVDVLQAAVSKVAVPGAVAEALEELSVLLERELQSLALKHSEYVPTKYFSQRSVVKALWALKAAVVRDRIYRRPGRPLEARVEDLEMLRYFFLLGGPAQADVSRLLQETPDARERAQLEILQLEHRAFDEVLDKALSVSGSGQERERAELNLAELRATAETLLRSFNAQSAGAAGKALHARLVPGPKHPENRAPLVATARMLVTAVEQRLLRGMAGQGEGRGGRVLVEAIEDALVLAVAVPELSDLRAAFFAALAEFARQGMEWIALSAESAEYDETLRLDGLAGLVQNLEAELSQLGGVVHALEHEGQDVAHVLELHTEVRTRVGAALRRRVTTLFRRSARGRGDPVEQLAVSSRQLAQLERALSTIDPSHAGLRLELLDSLGQAYAREALGRVPFQRLEQLTAAVTEVAETLRREGIPPARALVACRELLQGRVEAFAKGIQESPPQAFSEGVPSGLEGDAYAHYRRAFRVEGEGEVLGLLSLEQRLQSLLEHREPFFSPQVRAAVAGAELARVSARVAFLQQWFAALQAALPRVEALTDRSTADRVFDRLVRSRYPLLVLREGELARLHALLVPLRTQGAQMRQEAEAVERSLREMTEVFAEYSRVVLERRAAES